MSTSAMNCEIFESHLGELLEGGLDAAVQAEYDAHVRGCSQCAALVADLDRIVLSARELPLPSLSRDLWPAIEAQLQTSVQPLAPRRISRASVSWRSLSAAAAALVIVSASVSWNIARRDNESVPLSQALATNSAGTDAIAGSDVSVPHGIDAASNLSSATSSGGEIAQSRAAGDQAGSAAPVVAASNTVRTLAIDTLYGREIAMLRTVAEEQLGLLDSGTVAVVRRNLDIIDNAIRESRAALLGDPNSAFLLDQLDRAYERKVDLLRQLVLL